MKNGANGTTKIYMVPLTVHILQKVLQPYFYHQHTLEKMLMKPSNMKFIIIGSIEPVKYLMKHLPINLKPIMLLNRYKYDKTQCEILYMTEEIKWVKR